MGVGHCRGVFEAGLLAGKKIAGHSRKEGARWGVAGQGGAGVWQGEWPGGAWQVEEPGGALQGRAGREGEWPVGAWKGEGSGRVWQGQAGREGAGRGMPGQ